MNGLPTTWVTNPILTDAGADGASETAADAGASDAGASDATADADATGADVAAAADGALDAPPLEQAPATMAKLANRANVAFLVIPLLLLM